QAGHERRLERSEIVSASLRVVAEGAFRLIDGRRRREVSRLHSRARQREAQLIPGRRLIVENVQPVGGFSAQRREVDDAAALGCAAEHVARGVRYLQSDTGRSRGGDDGKRGAGLRYVG